MTYTPKQIIVSIFVVFLIFTTTTVTSIAEDKKEVASSESSNDVKNQIDRVENRLIAIERMVLGSAKSGNSTMLADHEARIQSLELESSKVYGTAEEVGNAVAVLAKKVELIASDLELRLQDIEKALAEGGSVTKAEKKTVETSNKPSKRRASASSKSKGVPTVPSGITPNDLYKQAYGYMKKAAFPTAKTWFETFTVRFPDHEKAENAYYWLGEVHLVQKNPQKALVAFGKGIKAFPNGARASDSLLKMGVAFQEIGKSNLAKTTWEKLVRDFPQSRATESAKKRLENLN